MSTSAPRRTAAGPRSADPVDGRCKLVAITPTGRDLLVPSAAIFERLRSDRAALLGEEQMAEVEAASIDTSWCSLSAPVSSPCHARGTADDLARCCQSAGGSATPVFADLATPAGAGDLLEVLDGAVGHVDILVGNAGVPNTARTLAELDGEQLADKVAADLAVAHTLATAYTAEMAERGYGRVILIGSIHAAGPSAPGMAAHGITKAALEAWVTYAAADLAGPGTTINIVHPGYIATDTTAHIPAAVTDLITALTPAARLGGPDDVAGLVALLAHPAAGWITGTHLPVTGGLNHPTELARVPCLHGTR